MTENQNTDSTYEAWLSKHGGYANSMTMRDYFAANAMHAYCSHSMSNNWMPHEIVGDAYLMADAMLKARGK